ncbi:uncharacterized protein V6R79_003161 [Siganus canaliculatus]
MEKRKENGGSFVVDLNENEEGGGVGGGGAGKTGFSPYIAALPAGVSGGQEAGKGHIYLTGNGRNVNRDTSVQPCAHDRDIMLDLVAAEEGHVQAKLTEGCVIAGVCDDHGGLNGFTESFGQEEPEGGGGGGGGGGGSTAASCPAVLPGRVSTETGRQMRQHPAGSGGPDSPDAPRGEEPADRLPCPGEHGCPGVNVPNGDVSEAGTAGWTQARGFSSPGPRLCNVDCEGVKVANGGLHIVSTTRTTQDLPGPDWSPQNKPSTHSDLGPKPEHGDGPGFPLETQSVCSGTLLSQCPEELLPSPLPSREHPTLESSAKPPSPCPSTPSPHGSPLSEPNIRQDEEEEDEDLSDLSVPVRPQSLRTHPGLPVSLSCDATPLSPDGDGGFYFGDREELRTALEAGRRQSAPDKLPDPGEHSDGSDSKMMPKRFGIAEFFTRSLFSRKPKEPKALSQNASGWRLFGRTAARDGDALKDAAASSSTLSTQQEEDEDEDEEEEEEGSGVSPDLQRPLAAARRKNLEFEPLSTTALILEDRPANLPAKSLEETLRHKMEYEEMVAGAKRREMKEAQKKKRQMKERHRQEDSISNAMVIWNQEILPHWDSMKGTRRVRELWWQGLPPSVRGRVWSLAIGNELNITPELYEIFLSRAKEKWRSYSETSSVNDSESEGASLADRESSLDLIKLDISRTFPSLFIFQKGGPYHDLLHSVLGAYTCYRPDIGYVQGMSFIAAVLILNLEEAEAFITFANLLNKPCHMAFFRVDHELMLKYFAAFEVFFEENLPRLFIHFQSNSLTPDLYLIDWIFTLYSKSLPLDVACRVWDVFCRDGEESLFRTALGILRLFEDVLLQMDFIHIAQFLTRLPDDLQPHPLFTAMSNTHMVSRNRRWAQVFSALMKDGSKDVDRNNSPALRT